MTQKSLHELDETASPQDTETGTLRLSDYLEAMERMAGQAGLDDYQGLQDACLLLLEALNESAAEPALLRQLDAWPALFDAYRADPRQATAEILAFLRSPELNLPLADEEFTVLKEMLLEDAPPEAAATDYLAALEDLAGQAGHDGLQGLQDACLLLVEALNEAGKPDAGMAHLLDAWPALAQAYREAPQTGIGGIIGFLRSPGLQLPLSEDEFAYLETMLAEDAARLPTAQAETALAYSGPAETATKQPAAADYLALLEGLAGQAGNEGWQGLQDACLLLVEALNESGEPDAALVGLIGGWPALAQAYREDPRSATADIIRCLREPALRLPLSDEEFAFLETQLLEPVAAQAPASTESSAPSLAGWSEDTPDEREARLKRLPRKARELVELLLMQADLIDAKAQAIVADDPQSVLEDLPEVQEQLERFANAAQTVGFAGLAQMCGFVEANVGHCLADPASFSAGRLGLIHAWLAQVKHYLTTLTEDGAGHGLLALLADTGWPKPLAAEDGAAMLAQLQGLDVKELGKEESSREQAATAADVSLALPGDVNQELLDILLQELPDQAQQLSESVQRLQAGGDLQDIALAQRIAHTLKGSANTVGIKGVATLTHHLEDILLACAKESKLPGPGLLNALIDATDCLESMGEALLGQGEPPADAQTVLQAVLDWANRIDQDGLEGTDGFVPPPHEAPAETAEEAGVAEAGPQAQAAEPAHPQASLLRVSAEMIDNLSRLTGESLILNGQAQERMRRMKSQLQAMQTQFELLRQLGSELDTLIDLRDLSGRSLNRAGEGFDALEMDQYNELHTASRRMVEAAVDAREISLDAAKELDFLDEVLEYQQNLVIESQGAVMQTKLVPIASILPRLQRSLRQTCRLTGKKAGLSLSGGQLMIDGDTLNTLVDPLMHLLRNAVDHGIESEQERLAVGKPAQGKIAIDFESEGNNILVRFRDDGHGLDFGAIRAAAEKRGLLQPGQPVAQEELERFILRPNFSSRAQSTQTSGRGVGMDVVRSQVVAMGGSLALHSVEGQGLTVALRVPLPLSRSHALLAHVGHYRVVVSSKGLDQVFFSGVGEVVEKDGEKRLLLENVAYPVARLGDLLHIAEHRREQRPHGAILVVRSEEQATAVLVDAVTDSREVVIKPLGHYLAKIPGIMGATILGDGTVTPVIDVPELLRTPVLAAQEAGLSLLEEVEEVADIPTVLVVDDSLSNRRALEQLLVDAGFKVRTAHDGVEAAELFAVLKPAIVLTDLEMLRMNGIELAAHIRTQPDGKTVPLIMITSRTTQRHRKLAEEAGIDFYLAKPVREDDLLDKMHSLLTPAAEEAHA